MGVTVTIGPDDDPDQDSVATIEYRIADNGDPYRPGLPMSRTSDTRFVGSIFWLEPGRAYDVRVAFSDPDGDAVDGIVLQASASTRPEIALPAPATSIFVSPTGRGTACSLMAPCALAEALNRAGPGDEVLLDGGVYYEGELEFPRSGTADAPIVLRGRTGKVAVLDGAEPATFAWSFAGGGVYSTTVNAADPNLVLADGTRLYPYDSLSGLQELSWDIPGFYASDTALYVRLPGDADPSGATMVVSRYERAFDIEQDFIYLLDLTFRHYGRGDSAKAINLDGGSDNLVQECTFAINNTGIVIKGPSHRNVIQDSEFFDATIDSWPWYAGKESGLETGGLRFGSETAGRGNVVRRNIFHDYFDGLHVCPEQAASETSEFDVYENLVYNAGDDGMETDGWCSNIRIWRNTIHDVLSGISLAPVYDGPVYAIRNLIYRTGSGNNDFVGTSFKFNSESDRSGAMYLFHNTADAAVVPGQDGLVIGDPGAWRLVYGRNNIWMGSRYALHNDNAAQPADLDYDDLWNGGAGPLIRWAETDYDDLAGLTAAVGQEPNALSVGPRFADPGQGDYALRFDSDLIDAGVVVPGVNSDYEGSAPDIGAYEHVGYGFELSVAPSWRAVRGEAVATYTVHVQSAGGFTNTVDLTADSTCPNLTFELTPGGVHAPGRASLTVKLASGAGCVVPITATSGDLVQTVSIGLRVDHAQMYLPVVVRELTPGEWAGRQSGSAIGFQASPNLSAVAVATVGTRLERKTMRMLIDGATLGMQRGSEDASVRQAR
jgi:hypothetical protein